MDHALNGIVLGVSPHDLSKHAFNFMGLSLDLSKREIIQ